MANNKHQESHWYNVNGNNYQICMYPSDQTLRDSEVYSQSILVWDSSRRIIYDNYFNTDEIFWSGVETQEKMLAYVKRVINGIIGEDLG